jgi:hypothetical protein
MDIEHGHKHAARTWTCSMFICPYCMFKYMLHDHVNAACSCPSSRDIDMQPGNGHAAWTSTCSIYWDMQHGHRSTSWTSVLHSCYMSMSILHVHVHTAHSYPCCMFQYYGRKKYCRHFFLSAEIENAVTFFYKR